jgi:hypothetical protein
MQNGDASVVARNQSALPGRKKDDSAIGQIGGREVVLPGVRSLVGRATRLRIGQPSQPGAVDANFINTRVARRFAFETKKELVPIPTQFRMRVNAMAQCARSGFVDDRADFPLVLSSGRVLEEVNAAAAGRPFVVSIVNVDAGVGMAFDEQQGRIENGNGGWPRRISGGRIGRGDRADQEDQSRDGT